MFWNTNGWDKDPASDHSMLRQLCTTEIDILGVADIKLEGEEKLAIPGYLWFGHNRKNIHWNAKCGSGGIVFFIRDSLCETYTITILDN